jgi:hypothetical protein
VNLINASNNVVLSAAVAANGSYGFTNMDPASVYSLILSTVQGVPGQPAPAALLPAGWVNTGTNLNGTTSSVTPGQIDAQLLGYTHSVNFDFGIEQLPNSDNHTTTISQPAISQYITLNGGANPPALSGVDPEDCNAGCTLANKSVIIDAVPANSELYYMGILVINGQQINNLDPSQLQIKITAATIGSTSFQYSYVDIAGRKDLSPATYNLNWLMVLPVTGLQTTARLNGSDAIVEWKTESEFNSNYFLVERSLDNMNFITTGNVSAAGNSNNRRNYSFNDNISSLVSPDIIYYRVRLVDIDNRPTLSNIAVVKLGKISGVQAWPNPFTGTITLSINSAGSEQLLIKFTNTAGQLIQLKEQQVRRGISQVTLSNLEKLASGVYFLSVENKNGGIKIVEKFIKE